MPKVSAKRVLAGAAVAVLLAVVVPPLLNVNRYRADVANAIARALGRNVSVGSVSLRVLPQPGFALSNFVVADDPSFSAEPVLLAQDVTASLRLSSLWRGRLEIAKLSLSYPSLNLVRRPDGRWNLESLLERATHSETAPTATKPEARSRFPYIEAEGGRINLKLGQEKKAYALSGADFALWLASERQWRLRLAAQPVRTDDNLSDTGTVRLSGSFGAAGDLMDTPVALQWTLEDAQLGQFTRLIYGQDRGWRGTLNATIVLNGTPSNLKVSASAALDDLHHFEIYGGNTARLGVQCIANVSASAQELRGLRCHSKLGEGVIAAEGWARWASSGRGYELAVSAQSLQARDLLRLARRMEQDLPDNVDAGGSVSASLQLARDERRGAILHSEGSVEDLVLRSQVLPEPLHVGKLQFGLAGPGTDTPLPRAGRSGSDGSGPVLTVAAFPLQLGGARAATAQAWLSSSGYRLQLQGDADAARVLRLARALALPAPGADIRGTARVNFELANTWAGKEGPSFAGTANLNNITARVDGLASRIEVPSGRLVISPTTVILRSSSLRLSDLPLRVAGWVRKPRGCVLTETAAQPEHEEACLLTFGLTADQVVTEDLARLLVPPKQQRPWYRLIRSSKTSASPLMRLHATGSITVGSLKVNSVAAHRVRTDVEWNRGLLKLKHLRAQVWDGEHAGELAADFRGAQPAYEWTGELRQVALQDLTGTSQRDSLQQPQTWAEGDATIAGNLRASGSTVSEIRASASGAFRVNWRRGVLHGLALDGRGGPLHVRALNGTLEFHAGEVKITDGWLQAPEGLYAVSGTANLSQELRVRLTGVTDEAFHENPREPREAVDARPSPAPRVGDAYSITGNWDDPIVQEVSLAETAGPLASSNKKKEQKPAAPEASVQKKEARNRNVTGRGSSLVPASRE